MSSESTRASLLSRLRDHRNHLAWREFDARYRDLILRYCRRRGLQASDAEDVRQMVLLNLAKQLPTFQYRPELGRFRDYLGRTVRNAIHRYYRKARPEVFGMDPSLAQRLGAIQEGDAQVHDPEWEAEWMHDHYRRAMRVVRQHSEPRSIEVFEALLGGRSVDEAAEQFAMSRDAVHKVKQRVRDRLRRLIEDQVRDEDAFDAPPPA